MRWLAALVALIIAPALYFGADPSLETQLRNKSQPEKADLKSEVISRIAFGTYTDQDLTIEVQSVQKIEGGVQILARAWKDGEPVGFSDGTVEIERFNIYNPPVLIDDPNGKIERTWTDRDGVTHTRTLSENPREAIKQRLATVIRQIGKDGSGIQVGKIGNTTSVFSSAAGSVSPVDGNTQRDLGSSGVAWATIQAGVGVAAASNDSANDVGFQEDNDTSNTWAFLSRNYFLFDTSSIPDTDTVSAATFTVYGSTRKFDQSSNSPTFNVYNPSVTNTAAIATGDHVASSWDTTALATAITYASWDNSGAGNVFTLNASGIANVSKTGISHFGMREATYDVAAVAPTWALANNRTLISTYFVDQSGTSLDPFLTVTHAAAGGGASVINNPSLIIIDDQ